MTDPTHSAFSFASLRLNSLNGIQNADENLDPAELERDVDERVMWNGPGLNLLVEHGRLPQRPS
jgi:hypothetical protein